MHQPHWIVLCQIMDEQDGDDDEQWERGVKLELVEPAAAHCRRFSLDPEELIKNGDAEDGKAQEEPYPRTAKHQGNDERRRERIDDTEGQDRSNEVQGRPPTGPTPNRSDYAVKRLS